MFIREKLPSFCKFASFILFKLKVEGGKENDHLPKFKFINREKTDTSKSYLTEAIEAIKKSKNVRNILRLII